MNRVLLKKLLRDISYRKLQLILLLTVISIGIGAYVGMAGVWRDMDGARQNYYRDYRLTHFTIDMKRMPQWVISNMQDIDNVSRLYGRINQAVLIDLPDSPRPISGQAISLPDYYRPELNDILLRTGSYLSNPDSDEVILNHAFAIANELQIGDRIRVLLVDQQHELLIVGTAQSPEFVYLLPPGGGLAPDPAQFGVMYLGESFLRRSSDLGGAYNQLLGQVNDTHPTAIDNTLHQLANRLDTYGVIQTTPAQDQPSVRYLHDELAGLAIQSRVLPAIFLTVGALVLSVLMGRLVSQQRTVIGTLRAIGYSSISLVGHYQAFGLIIGIAGGLSGLALGHWLQAGMITIYRDFYELPDLLAHSYLDISLTGLAISLIFAQLGCLYGAFTITRLQPADAMRPPQPEHGTHIWLEWIPALWYRLSFHWKMVLRSVFRNPFRSVVSLLASLIATALVFTTLSLVDSLDYMMGYEFTRVSHQDLSISLRDPIDSFATNELSHLPGIAGIEPELVVTSDLNHGLLKERVAVIGLQADRVLHLPQTRQHTPVPIPQQGLLLSRKLAEILDLKIGDTLQIRPLLGERLRVKTNVAAIVDNFLGLSAYADSQYLSRLLGEQQVSNQVLLKSTSLQNSESLMSAIKQRPMVIGLTERLRALQQLDDTFGKTMGTMISVMVLFASAIAVGSILNTVLVSLSERQREIGTLRVLGYTPLQVAKLFFSETLLLSSLGVMLGLFVGVGLSQLLSSLYSTELYRFPTIILPSTLLQSASLMLVIIAMAQAIIYYLINKLDWLESLKVKE